MTDDQLAALLDAIRKHIRDAPPGTWPDTVLQGARTVTEAVSARLLERTRG